MNQYRYKAFNENGKSVRGLMSAENPLELEALLRTANLDMVSFSVEKDSFLSNKNLNHKDLIALFSHLEQLDRAGVSVLDSIADVRDSSDSPKVRHLMQEIYEALKNGSMLSNAFGKHPKTFPSVFIGLIATGEKVGNLHSSFNSIIGHLKWSMEMKRKTTKAIRYPLFSLAVMLCVLGIMTTFVVPKVTSFLQAQKIELPGTTVALISFSEFVQDNGFAIVIIIPLLVIGFKALNKVPSLAPKIDGFKLHIPIFGKIIAKIEASRFCHFFSITFKSGLGILECLDSAREVVSNKAMNNSIEEIKQQVSNGQKLSKAIESSGYFPSLVIRMFEVGETSGNMEEALSNIKFFFDQEINDSIDKMVGMIQPSLTFVMGGMMAWITIAVFGPIYSSFGNI